MIINVATQMEVICVLVILALKRTKMENAKVFFNYFFLSNIVDFVADFGNMATYVDLISYFIMNAELIDHIQLINAFSLSGFSIFDCPSVFSNIYLLQTCGYTMGFLITSLIHNCNYGTINFSSMQGK